MNNTKIAMKLVALLLVVAALLPVGAMAANHEFSFSFSNLANQTTASYQKSDSEQHWYVSLDKINSNTGIANTLGETNILGLRMNQKGVGYVSEYHTFSNYVTSYQLDYTSTVTTSMYLYMGAKKDSDSTSSTALRISGRFCP